MNTLLSASITENDMHIILCTATGALKVVVARAYMFAKDQPPPTDHHHLFQFPE
jgi:hypothetical protein